MRWMVIYEYELPGGALNLNSTNYPDHGHHGNPPLSGNNPRGRARNRTRDLMISSQKQWPLDHKAGLFLPQMYNIVFIHTQLTLLPVFVWQLVSTWSIGHHQAIVQECKCIQKLFVCFWYNSPTGPEPPHSRGFYITHDDPNTVSRTPLDEWSARHRDLYLTTHNTHNRQTSMPPVGFEPQSQQVSGCRPTS
jgi:hypothetical protein